MPTVTLLVSPEEAEKLTLATRYEPVRLALRNYSDDQMVGTPGLSTATLFGAPARQVVAVGAAGGTAAAAGATLRGAAAAPVLRGGAARRACDAPGSLLST